MKDSEASHLLQELSKVINHPLPSPHDILTDPSTFANFLSVIKEHAYGLIKEKDELQKSFSTEQAAKMANEQAITILENKYKRQEEELVHTKELLTTLQGQSVESG